MPFDVAATRAQFPSLASGIAHFDGPGGTQAPAIVGEAVARTLTGPLSNRGTGVASEQNAEDAILAFRAALADLLGASPAGIVYGRSATQITYDFSRHLAKTWAPGDEVVVTQLDHDANVRPWIQAASAAGVTVRWLRLDPTTAELRLDELDKVVGERTRLVAVTAASNLLGTKPPVDQIARRAHEVGALVYVDGVHYTAHAAVDIAALGADFFVCSPYKFFGPHCAALAADPALLETLKPDKLLPSTNDVPERFEFGTLPVRNHGRRHCGGRLHRRSRTFRRLPSGPACGGAPGHRRARSPAAAPDRGRPGDIPRSADRPLGGGGPHADPLPHVPRQGPGRCLASSWPRATSWRRPARSMPTSRSVRSSLEVDAGLRVGLAPYNDDLEIDRLLGVFEEFMHSH